VVKRETRLKVDLNNLMVQNKTVLPLKRELSQPMTVIQPKKEKRKKREKMRKSTN
jgi:hypothetical protein